MKQALLPTREWPRFKREAWVCLLLLGLLLYNPFAKALGNTDHSSIDKRPSNRATVGASELQHFSPVSKSVTQTVHVFDAVGIETIQASDEDGRFNLEPLQRHSSVSEILVLIWNRPPPAS